MSVSPAKDLDVVLVLKNMRASNAREIFASKGIEDSGFARAALAMEINSLRPVLIERWCFRTKDGTPAALMTAHLKEPGVAQIFMVATDRWSEVARTVYRFCRDVLYKRGLSGIRRCETRVIEDSDYRWLLRLGYREVVPSGPRGKNGEKFIRLAWEKPDV